MRYSIIEGDAGYENYVNAKLQGKDVRVSLNDKRLNEVITADTDLGLVLVFKRDPRGDLIYNPVDGEIEQEWCSGVVSVDLYDPFNHAGQRALRT